MCDNIDVALYNEVFDSRGRHRDREQPHCTGRGNYVHDNTGGILAFHYARGLPIKTTYDVIMRNNFIVNNKHPELWRARIDRVHGCGRPAPAS